MNTTLKYLLLSSFLFSIISAWSSKDPAFVKKYKVQHLKPGDGINFPVKSNKILMHWRTFDTDTGTKVVESSRNSRDSRPFELRYKHWPFNFFIPHCFQDILYHMSKGEMLQVRCKPPHNTTPEMPTTTFAFDMKGDAIFEIELIDFMGQGRFQKDEL